MKSSLLNLNIIIFIWFSSTALIAQSVSTINTELEQKVEVLEDILQKILFEKETSNRNVFIWNSKKIETIISDNGIIMTVNQPNNLSDIVVEGIASIEVNKTDTESTISMDMKNNETNGNGTGKNQTAKESFEVLKPKIEDFFANYTLLLRELPDEATITVVVKNTASRYVFRVNSSQSIFGETQYKSQRNDEKELRASVSMKDVRQLNQEKLSRDKFNTIITFDISAPKETPTDITIFNNIIETLYSRNSTKDYFISEQVNYSDLGNIGYRFTFALYSSFKEGNGFRVVASEKLNNATQLEKDQFVLDSYPKWKENFMNYLADYAITMRSLEKSNTITFEATLPSCPSFDKEMPDIVEFSFASTNLEDIRSGKMSIDKFKKNIHVKELENN